MEVFPKYRSYFVSLAFSLTYGLAVRLLIYSTHADAGQGSNLLWPTGLYVMTAGFVIVCPFAVGWISVPKPAQDARSRWVLWIFMPWIAIAAGDLLMMALAVEGSICILFALPIQLLASSLGGIAAGVTHRARFHRATTLCVAFLPMILSAVEMQGTAPRDIRTVNTEIRIKAPASIVFRNIERVPAISPSEIRPSWSHRIGFPLPVEATLDHEGIGGVRHATFQGGLLFIETINEWAPDQRIGFTIAADTAHIPPTTLDEHVTIGGPYFDVLDGEYRIEPLADGDILLHLSSRERLSTGFNAYAALWTDGVMRDLQQSILEVVKHRCEVEALKQESISPSGQPGTSGVILRHERTRF